MFSVKNSYDYKNKYNNIETKLPFEGEYEALDNYKFIYIYENTEKIDNLTIQFTNKKNDISYEIEDTTYNEISGEKEIVIPKKLKYFRIKIDQQTGDFNSNDKRIYNTYYLDTQYVKSSAGGSVTIVDEDGNSATVTGGSLDVNVINTSVTITNEDLTSIKTAVEKIDDAVSGNYIQTKLNDYNGTGITSTINGTKTGLDVNVINTSVTITNEDLTSIKTAVEKIPLTQSSATTGQYGSLIQGAVTTGAPTYTNGNTNPLSLTTSGALRITEDGYNLNKDALNRLRVSHPFTLFDSKNVGKKMINLQNI